MQNLRIHIPIYTPENLDFTFRYEGVGADAPAETSQETIRRRFFDLYPEGRYAVTDHLTWLQAPLRDAFVDAMPVVWAFNPPIGLDRAPVSDFQAVPLSDDNYESFSLRWDFANPRAIYREPHQGAQLAPARDDFFEPDQQTLNRAWLIVPDGLDRNPLYNGFQAAPLADDNYESFKRTEYDLAPRGLDRHSTLDFQAQPLADDNFESFTRTWTDVPVGANPQRDPWLGQQTIAGFEQDFQGPVLTEVPSGRNPFQFPWDGVQAQPLSADAQVDVPLTGLNFPAILFKRHRHEPLFIYDGFSAEPLPPDAAPGVNTVWRPTFMPRRR